MIEEDDGGSVPHYIKHAAIDLYCRLNRAEEEVALIKSEMINVLTHHLKEQNNMYKCFEKYRHETLHDCGTITLLKQERKVALAMGIGLAMKNNTQSSNNISRK